MSHGSLRLGPLRLLVLLILLLTAGLAWMWFDEHAQLRQLAWAPPKPLAPDIKVPAGPPKTDSTAGEASPYAVILERPIFAPDRRQPPPPPPPAPPTPPDPMASIQILGVFSGERPGILARVDGKVRRVKITEAIGPWTLKSIGDRDVTFIQGEEIRQMRLAFVRLDTPASQTKAANVTPASTATAASAPAPAANPAPDAAQGAVRFMQNQQDETRARLQRRNELRASRGMPPLTE
jgi:general secretion pathway protein N